MPKLKTSTSLSLGSSAVNSELIHGFPASLPFPFAGKPVQLQPFQRFQTRSVNLWGKLLLQSNARNWRLPPPKVTSLHGEVWCEADELSFRFEPLGAPCVAVFLCQRRLCCTRPPQRQAGAAEKRPCGPWPQTFRAANTGCKGRRTRKRTKANMLSHIKSLAWAIAASV